MVCRGRGALIFFGLFVCIMAIACGSARAEHYFVQAQTGSDDNPGTSNAPIQTLTHLAEILRDGDTAHLSGVFTDTFFIRRVKALTIRQWQGHPQAEIVNSRQVRNWVAVPGTTAYAAPVGAQLDITAVSVRWGDPTNCDADGRPKTFLVYDPTLASTNSWWYDRASGWLAVNMGGEDPDAGRHYRFPVEYCLGDPTWVGMNLETARGCVVDGIHFRHAIGSGIGTYGLKIGGKNNTIRNCKSWHISWHHLAFVGSGTDACYGNVMEDCECFGLGNTHTANMVVLFSTYDDVRKNRVVGVNLNVYQMLHYGSGEPLNPNIVLDGFYAHTGGQGAIVTDNDWLKCNVHFFENSGAPFGLADADPARSPSPGTLEELDWTKWPNRVSGCVFDGLTTIGSPIETAFSRCTFLAPRFEQVTGPASLFNYNGIPGHRTLLFDACYLGYSGAGAGYKSVFLLTRRPLASQRLIMLNTTVAQFNPSAINRLRLITYEGTADAGNVQVYGSVIDLNHGGAGGELIVNDTLLIDQRFRFEGNWYHGINSSSYSSWTPRSTMQGWQRLDPPSRGAVYDVRPELDDAKRCARPRVGGALDAGRWYQFVHAPRGINDVPYQSCYGAWQGPAK